MPQPSSPPSLFNRHSPGLGTFGIRALDADADASLLHTWFTQPRARSWGMLDAEVDDVRRAYERIARSGHHRAMIGELDGRPHFLVERYDPRHDPVGKAYEPAPGDVGMHLLVAPADEPVAGFTREVFRTVMAFLFDDEETTRVVVEPDVGNDKILRLNELMGFRRERVIQLPDKRAWLSSCTRSQHADAVRLVESGRR